MSNLRVIPNRDLARHKLLNLVKSELKSRWQTTLHNHIYFSGNSGHNSSPITIPLTFKTQEKDNNQSVLSSEQISLIDILEKSETQGQLVILGQSGSGKSTILLQLAQILLDKAEQNDLNPMPILLNLSLIQNHPQTFKQWLRENLQLVYGVRTDIAKKWIEESTIIPLLDGLDRLTVEHQQRCVEMINQFLVDESWSNPFIVCDEFTADSSPSNRFNLNHSLVLQPLTGSQIQTYLLDSDSQNLWDTVQSNSNLMTLAQVPLFLNMMVIMSAQMSEVEWGQIETVGETRQKLLTIYCQLRLSQSPKKMFRQDLMQRWLGWLAIKLKQNGFSDFRVEYLQPYWLETIEEKMIYGAIFGIIVGSIYALSLFVIFIRVIIFNDSSLYQFWSILALLTSMGAIITFMMIAMEIFYGLRKDIIHLTDSDYRSPLRERKIIKKQLIRGLIYGFVFGLLLENPLVLTAFTGGLGLIIGFVQMLVERWSQRPIERRIHTNQSFYQKATQGIYVISLILIPSLIIFWALSLGTVSFLLIDDIRALMVILLGTLVYFSLYPVWQHLTLRSILWLFLHSPFNYTKFLDYAVDCSLMQKIRGNYQFSHQSLQESLAKLAKNRKK